MCQTHGVLVEQVERGVGKLIVAYVPMHEQQSLQESELADGEVRGHGSLHAFLPTNPHADVRGLQHVHVVRPVTDGQRLRVQSVFDQTHNLCLQEPWKEQGGRA